VIATSRRRFRGIAVTAGVMAAVLGIASCSSGSSGGKGDTSTLHMAFVYADTTQNPFQEMAWGAQAAAQQDGHVDLTESAPTGINNPQEVSQFQSAINSSPDGIAVMTVAPNLFPHADKQAVNAGVPVATVDAPPPAGSGVKMFVGNSNTQVGQALGDAFIKKVPPNAKGQVVLGDDIPGLELLTLRLQGLEQVIKKERPGLTILGPYNSGSDATQNYNAWQGIVKAHPNAIAYLGVGGQDGVSLPLIEKQLHRKFLAGSCDIPLAALQAVQQGYLFALSSPEHWLKGYIAMSLLIKSKRTGKPLPTGWWNPGTLIIDSSNVASIIAREQSNTTRDNYFRARVQYELAHPSQYMKPLADAN
jgi:ribose transport system substrate-binding protein